MFNAKPHIRAATKSLDMVDTPNRTARHWTHTIRERPAITHLPVIWRKIYELPQSDRVLASGGRQSPDVTRVERLVNAQKRNQGIHIPRSPGNSQQIREEFWCPVVYDSMARRILLRYTGTRFVPRHFFVGFAHFVVLPCDSGSSQFRRVGNQRCGTSWHINKFKEPAS